MFGKRKDSQKLSEWQARYAENRDAYDAELRRMDRREALCAGTTDIKGTQRGKATKPATLVRNVVAELIEGQVSSSIPQPKVTAMREADENKAAAIEDLLRNLLDLLPTEYFNDQQERTTYIQGGAYALVEWDSTKHTHTTAGELCLTDTHPKKVIPQDGVYADVEKMDYIFVVQPQTKQAIKKRYGVTVDDESESEPEVRGASSSTANDIVTQVIAYYRNDNGGIGMFSWVNEQVLVDMEDYQARRLEKCVKCDQPGDGKECKFCGSKKFRESTEDFETLSEDIIRTDGSVIPALSEVLDDMGMPIMREVTDAAGAPVMQVARDAMGMEIYDDTGMPVMEAAVEVVTEPTKIPYYKPDVYPIVLRKNVSVFGRVLGDSDVDKIEHQQEALKKLDTTVMEKLLKGGSVLTVPRNAIIDLSDEQLRVLRLDTISEKEMIEVLDLQANIAGDVSYAEGVYNQARNIIGITDSFQGRRDTTATSGKAKEFAARQSAGRLESKRVMKDAAYARMFEVMFKFYLAYADEPRTVVSRDNQGRTAYGTFSRYDFLERDELTGEWYWNDRFLFSTDASAALAANREAMWQETRMNLQQGCYGNPQELETLIVFWTRMEQLHYPDAAATRVYLENKREQQMQAAQQQMQAMGGMPGAQMPPMDGGLPPAAPPMGGAMQPPMTGMEGMA